MADEAKLFPLLEAQKERAERDSRGAGGGPTSDDGVECLGYFEFDPVRAALGNVGTVESLGDDAF